MKLILTCLLSALLCTPAAFAQRVPGENGRTESGAQTTARGQLQLTTSIIKHWSCGPGNLSLALKLSFRNAGTEPVILSKRILMGGLMVSRDLDDAAAKKYELSLRYTDYSAEPGFGFKSPTDLSAFSILRPGEVYESEEHVSVPTHLGEQPAADPRRGLQLSDGTHYLQITVGTWPYVAPAAPLRRKWRDKGLLWSQGLVSSPMPFTVDRNQPAIPCP